MKGNPRRARHPKQNNITLQRTNISIEIGTTFTRHGLEYEVAGFRPHVTRSGREIELVKLASECSVCGGGFTTTATRSAVRGSARHNGITRTCPEHRGLGPRWRRPPPLIDAAVVALAERRGQFLSARQLAEATGRSASGMSNALSRAFCGQHGNAIKTARGRLVRRPGRSHLPTLYLLAPAGKPLSAAAGRVASTEWLRGALFERLGL